MTNEEFQRIVLKKFDNMETRFDSLEKGQEEIRKELKTTTELSEFRTEVNEKLDSLQRDIYAMEIITSKNWST